MKKMLLIATLAVAAVTSQAATLKWSANNIKDANGTAISGGVAYLFAVENNCGYENFTAADLDAAAKAGTLDVSKAIATTKTGTAGQISLSGIGNFGAGDSLKAIFVVYDGSTIGDSSNFQVSGGPLSASWISATGEQGVAFGNMSTGANKSASGWTAVPEPCSGALIALGLAAVALKRKVA